MRCRSRPLPRITFPSFWKNHGHLRQRQMYHIVSRIVLAVSSGRDLQSSSRFRGRRSFNKACLIWKRMKGGGVKSYFNEPGNVMHLAQQLWWESINSNINARIWVAIHVSQALQLRENTVVLLHGLALLERSPETCRTFSLHILLHDVSLCSTSVKQITPTVCRWDGPGNGHCWKFWFA